MGDEDIKLVKENGHIFWLYLSSDLQDITYIKCRHLQTVEQNKNGLDYFGKSYAKI